MISVDPTPMPVTTVPGTDAAVLTDQLPCFREQRSSLCKRVYEWTDSAWLAENSDWLIARPSRILVIVAIAVVARWVAHRAIRRVCERAINRSSSLAQGRTPAAGNARANLRRRAATLGSVLESLSTTVIFTIALLTVMAELSFNIGPLIASAGIAGVAIGFGAQAVVKDFLSGVFMILEDQFGVGDEVDLGVLDLEETHGVVESVGLRITSVRDDQGKLWHVRNGEIVRVGNADQPSSRAPRAASGEEVT
jgi:small conductance mechanosensitive channel